MTTACNGQQSMTRKQHGRGHRPREAGASAIEFALVAPMLVLILGCLAETGAFILIQTQLQLATDTAAREIRTGKVGPASTAANQPNQMTLSEFKAIVCGKFSVPNCTTNINVDVQSDTSFALLRPKLPSPLENVGPQNSGGSYSEAFTPGAPGQMGSLVVTYDWRFVFPMVGLIFGNVQSYPGIRRLVGLAVYQNEL